MLDVTVNFALPVEADTTALEVPRIETDAPAGYRAVLAVQNDSRHQLSLDQSQNLAPLPVGLQRKLLPERVRRSLQCVFESYTENWSVSLKLTPAKVARRVQIVVDLLALTTVIDRRGNCRYEARLTLQNRSEQFLRVKVPDALKLWSAEVAGQEVRPVRPGKGAADEVLIPLVKTSPGGLPYDLKLYFAGRAVAPLDDLTRIRPPAIAILGAPFMRTTWSLRLPRGYRYVRPGGNMSPVASIAETMTIAIEARLKQLERLEQTVADTSSLQSDRGRDIAGRNWEWFNKNVAGEIRQAKRFIADNRALIGDDWGNLSGKVEQQYRFQQDLLQQRRRRDQDEQARADGNVNYLLNRYAQNPGLAEIAREAALNEIPIFVQRASEEQKAQITARLRDSAREIEKRQKQVQGSAQRPGAQPSAELDKAAQAGAVQLRRLQQRQQVLTDQLGHLEAGRAQRYYKRARLGEQAAPQTAPRRPVRKDEKLDRRPDAADDDGDRPGRPRPTARPTAPGGPPAKPADDYGVAPLPYAAEATFSLPVELPEGEVRLDFARPGGDAELSVWAVGTRMIHSLCGTGAVIVAVLIILVILRLAARTKLSVPPPLFAGYVVLAVVLLVLAGVFGLVVWAIIALAAEVLRRWLARRAVPAANGSSGR